MLLLRRNPQSNRWLPQRQFSGLGRVRGGVQGSGGGRRSDRGEEADQSFLGRAEGEGLLDGARSRRPRSASQRLRSPRLLRRRRPPFGLRILLSRLRLLQSPRCEFPADSLEAALRHCGGHRPGAALPAQAAPEKDHPQGHQGLKHTPHRKLRTTDLRFRPCEVASIRVDSPRRRTDRRNLRVLGAGVLHARDRGREDGRLRIWCLPAGDRNREEACGWLSQELALLDKRSIVPK
ncbi:Protein kinase domain containing protein [Musa troglodytarum]|uniref:Protein kinase domain containing protein n=1 Tax=Musa troglodytarum TaxID=320322 RepID=A0A9E7FVV1_9LILI|nr:Protein kinase domain containing protein [Musa troglodytarum]